MLGFFDSLALCHLHVPEEDGDDHVEDDSRTPRMNSEKMSDGGDPNRNHVKERERETTIHILLRWRTLG